MELTSAFVEVLEQTQVAEARRRTLDLASRLGFDETLAGQAAIAATEAATNLVKHGGGGHLFVGVSRGNANGLQIVAMDRGRGIRDVRASIEDGMSTAGTAGNGLGAIRRLATTFDIFSVPEAGTVVAAGIYPPRVHAPNVAGIAIPAPRELECGDAWGVWSAGELTSVFVADGLGHGHDAAVASRAAVTAFMRHAERNAEYVIQAVHDAMKSTRGGAVAVAELDRRRGIVNYCGLGNIAALIADAAGKEHHLVSLSGIAGHVNRRLQTFTYPWLPGSTLIMHSDGIGSHVTLAQYPGLARRDAGVIAGVVARDHRRGHDDATVVVAKYGAQA